MKFQRTSGPDCISDLTLDKWRANEESESLHEVKRHLDSCSRCTARLRAIDSARDSFPIDTAGFSDVVKSEVPTLWERLRRWLVPGVPLLGVAVAFVLWLSFANDRDERATSRGTRRKGSSPTLEYYLKRSPGNVHTSNTRLYPGDMVRFTYSSHVDRHLIIVSRDGSDVRSIYYAQDGFSAFVPAGVNVALPEAILLDETLGDEVVYGFFCTRKIAVSEVVSALEDNRENPDIDSCSLSILRWEKVAP